MLNEDIFSQGLGMTDGLRFLPQEMSYEQCPSHG